jgi:hypothetical protein
MYWLIGEGGWRAAFFLLRLLLGDALSGALTLVAPSSGSLARDQHASAELERLGHETLRPQLVEQLRADAVTGAEFLDAESIGVEAGVIRRRFPAGNFGACHALYYPCSRNDMEKHEAMQACKPRRKHAVRFCVTALLRVSRDGGDRERERLCQLTRVATFALRIRVRCIFESLEEHNL